MPEWIERAAPSLLGVFLAREASPRKSGLYVRHLCRCFPKLFPDPRSWLGLDAADQFEAGELTEEQFKVAIRPTEEAANERQAEHDSWLRDPERDYTRNPQNGLTAANMARAVATTGYYPSFLIALRGIGLRSEGKSTCPRSNLIAKTMRPLFLEHFGDPRQPVEFDQAWLTSDVLAIASGMYKSGDFSPMPILADALQDAGCDNENMLSHSRDPKANHVRGCWVVDLVLGKS